MSSINLVSGNQKESCIAEQISQQKQGSSFFILYNFSQQNHL